MNNLNNFNDNAFIQNELHKGNSLKRSELLEKQAMRKAYCKANNIPFEEVEINEETGFGQGSLKIFLLIIWIFIVGVTLSVLIAGGSFSDFLGWWF